MPSNAVHAVPPTSAAQAHATPQPQGQKPPSALPQDKVTLSAAAQSQSRAPEAKAEPSAPPKPSPLINAKA